MQQLEQQHPRRERIGRPPIPLHPPLSASLLFLLGGAIEGLLHFCHHREGVRGVGGFTPAEQAMGMEGEEVGPQTVAMPLALKEINEGGRVRCRERWGKVAKAAV